VTKAEITWALNVVSQHSSYRSCSDVSKMFAHMFPDSAIAKKFTLGPSKVAYTVVYGLAPYFNSVLVDAICESPSMVVCFDEALNKIAQKGQMDLVIRFWDHSSHTVSTRYLTSVFLGHATAKDLEEKFLEGISSLPLSKLLQVSMDGPSVNWKFLDALTSNFKEKHDRKLLQLGSCGLHVIHGAFQYGHKASGWAVNEFLRSLHGIFKNSPARRADYTALTGTSLFPKKFCQVRWVENADVAARALEILPHVKKYVEAKSKDLPHTYTATTLKNGCADPLITAKIAFFASVAVIVEPFLIKYQTSKPMVPFLYDDVVNCLHSLMTRFVKKSVLQAADTPQKLIKIDLKSDEVLLTYKDIDVGVAAKKEVSQCKISDREKMQFRMECRKFLSAMTAKIVERSPVQHKLARFASCLVPKTISNQAVLAEKWMSGLLDILYESKNVSSVVADKAKVQFAEFVSRAQADLKPVFDSFTNDQRLDVFFYSVTAKDYSELWSVVQTLLILSHGNASVESGFSINTQMLVENMHEESLVGQRQVFDAVKAAGGILSVEIAKRMLQYVRLARSRYHEALEKKKAEKANEKRKCDANKRAAVLLKELSAKKAKFTRDTAAEMKTLDNEIAEVKAILE
jgi:hypothetical protein